jgi:hypothetical protein
VASKKGAIENNLKPALGKLHADEVDDARIDELTSELLKTEKQSGTPATGDALSRQPDRRPVRGAYRDFDIVRGEVEVLDDDRQRERITLREARRQRHRETRGDRGSVVAARRDQRSKRSRQRVPTRVEGGPQRSEDEPKRIPDDSRRVGGDSAWHARCNNHPTWR